MVYFDKQAVSHSLSDFCFLNNMGGFKSVTSYKVTSCMGKGLNGQYRDTDCTATIDFRRQMMLGNFVAE